MNERIKSIVGSIYFKVGASLIALYTLIGFILLPLIIEKNFTKVVQERLGTYGTLEKISINPYSFEIKIKNLLIKDLKQKDLLFINSLTLDVAITKTLSKEIKITSIVIDRLKTNIDIYKDGSFNFSHILKSLQKGEKKQEIKEDPTKEGFIFSLDTFLLQNTELLFSDSSRGDTFIVATKPFNLSVHNFSTLPETVAQFATDINFKDTLNLESKIDFSLFPTAVIKGDVGVGQVQLDRLYQYLKRGLLVKFGGEIGALSSSFEFSNEHNLTYQLSDIKLDKSEVTFVDLQKDPKKEFVVKDLNLSVDKISSDTTKESNVTLSLKLPHRGDLNTNFLFLQEPFNINGALDIKELSLQPYLGYIQEFVTVDIKSGLIGTHLDFNIETKKQRVLGELHLLDFDIFSLKEDKRLVEFHNFLVDGINYRNNNLQIESITLDTFKTAFKIDKNKKTNFAGLVNSQESNSSQKKRSQRFHYYIKNLHIKDGKANFSDHSLPLEFDTLIHGIQAEIKDLSSQNDLSNIKLQGVIEEYGLATIKAKTVLVDFKNKTDVAVNFENIDITSFSPYSGKFIGQKIADGKLWLDLEYSIRDSQLSSSNRIRIKDMTLGEDVNSTEALNLPVGLAIALLEDSEGMIDVKVPVGGDVDSPEFELSGVIWQAIGNVITNVITAPFRFLGSLLGLDSDELGSVEFRDGSDEILPPQREKLDKLGKLLKEKQSLVLVINPVYNKQSDTKALIEQKFMKMTQSKNRSLTIKKLYQKEFGKEKYKKILSERKSNENNQTKQIDLMTQLSSEIKKSIKIETSELETLAKRRVGNIKEYLLLQTLPLERIMVKEEIFSLEENSSKIIPVTLEVDVKTNK